MPTSRVVNLGRPRTRWDHLSEIPKPIRESLGEIFSRWDKRDLQVDSALELLVDDDHARQQACQVLRSASNRARIPAFCGELSKRHPDLSKRQVFRAVGHFLGLHPKWIQRVFYRSIP